VTCAVSVSVALVLTFSAERGFCSLILDGSVALKGNGIRSAPALLTMRSPGYSSTASGCVGWDGLFDVTGEPACMDAASWGGDELTGASQTHTRALSEIGISSAADLRILFLPLEPSGGGITVNDLLVRVFSPDGTPLYTSGPFTLLAVESPAPGHPAVFVFRLDEAGLAGAANGAFSNPFNRIGLAATVTYAGGGPERFLAASAESLDRDPPGETPEPAPAWLVGLGLLVAVAAHRSRHRGSCR